jgi:hypothetical protein
MGTYKFGNNIYPQRIRRRSNLGHIFREKKCVLWVGKYSILRHSAASICLEVMGNYMKPEFPDLQNTTKSTVLCHAVTYRLLEVKMFLKLKEPLYKSSLDNSITFLGC